MVKRVAVAVRQDELDGAPLLAEVQADQLVDLEIENPEQAISAVEAEQVRGVLGDKAEEPRARGGRVGRGRSHSTSFTALQQRSGLSKRGRVAS